MSKELARYSVVVFDEAHNIDNICIDSMSVRITRKLVDKCVESVGQLEEQIQKLKEANSQAGSLREQLSKSEEVSNGLLEKLNSSNKVDESCRSSDVIINDARNATVVKKVNTVRPLNRPETHGSRTKLFPMEINSLQSEKKSWVCSSTKLWTFMDLSLLPTTKC